MSEVLAMMNDVDALGATSEEEMEEMGESVETGVETGVEEEVEEVESEKGEEELEEDEEAEPEEISEEREQEEEVCEDEHESDKEEAVPKESSKKETVVEKEPPSAASSKSKEKYDLEYAINGKTYSLVITQNKPNQGACITIKKVSGKTQNYVERTKDDVVQPVVFKKKKYDVYAPRNTTLKTLTTNTALVASLFLLSRIDACSLWSPDSPEHHPAARGRQERQQPEHKDLAADGQDGGGGVLARLPGGQQGEHSPLALGGQQEGNRTNQVHSILLL